MTTSRLLTAVVLLALATVCWVGFLLVSAVAPDLGMVVYVLATLIVTVDLFDLGIRLLFRHLNTDASRSRHAQVASIPLAEHGGGLTASLRRLHLHPYAFAVSLHNAANEIDDFLSMMLPFRDRTWLIDDASTDQTVRYAQQAGFYCISGGLNRKKPSAIRALLAVLPREIETVIVLDPDVRLDPDLDALEAVVFDFQRSGLAALCPALSVREEGVLGLLQGLEYHLSMGVGRRRLSDFRCKSGVAMYRRDALADALADHSLSVYAEDLENTLILLSKGEGIYYDGRLRIETDGKITWGAWFSQRVGWSYGLLKVYAERFAAIARGVRGRLMATYQYLIYLGGFSLLLHPLRVVAVAILAVSFANGIDNLLALGLVGDGPWTHPAYFAIAYLEYLLLVAIGFLATVPAADGRRLLPAVPLYFLYMLAHVVPTTVGYCNWLSLRFGGRRLYRDHYQEDQSLGEAPSRTFATPGVDAGA